MKEWIEISEEDKLKFKELAQKASHAPTCFNLESDKKDIGGKFAELTNEQVLEAAEKSAKHIMNTMTNG